MAFVKAAPAGMVPPGALIEAQVQGRSIAICNVDGTLYAVDGVCPHAGGPLGHGALHGTILVCPFHAWEFDCRTGENHPGSPISVQTFAVKQQGGDILVDLDQRAGTP